LFYVAIIRKKQATNKNSLPSMNRERKITGSK